MKLPCLVAAALIAAAGPARAEETLDVNRPVHGTIIVVGITSYALAEGVFKAQLSTDLCRWCGPILFDQAVADGLKWERTDVAHQLSNITGFALAPVVALGGIHLAGRFHERNGADTTYLDDLMIVTESAVIAANVNFIIKAAVGRERPFVHRLADEAKPLTEHPQDNNQSFYSGHSTYTMSLAVSAGTVASMRGYRWAPALWATGIGLSLTTGYLRIAADKHWTTDVVTGWVTGAAIGFLVPQLHRRSSTGGIMPAASEQTIGMSMVF